MALSPAAVQRGSPIERIEHSPFILAGWARLGRVEAAQIQARRTNMPHPSPLPRVGLLGPVAQILAEGAKIRARRTSTPLPFTMAYTNPAVDLDVSEVMERTGMVEGGITQVGMGRGEGR